MKVFARRTEVHCHFVILTTLLLTLEPLLCIGLYTLYDTRARSKVVVVFDTVCVASGSDKAVCMCMYQ